jgi:hypothetical protein
MKKNNAINCGGTGYVGIVRVRHGQTVGEGHTGRLYHEAGSRSPGEPACRAYVVLEGSRLPVSAQSAVAVATNNILDCILTAINDF